ncbi:phosphate transporter PHO1 homolog 9-like isoform X2 [Mangifera indica]|uniref:phosphate transporter PHO1 homolog 9-like isoform X2 n=1 Tax=Mangifera indica TaxID=29780 RepID=UPI001CFA63FD|nr:phosphate transporter PHO1 homolog 9-like isoform X2 [Mangifera indica]
MKFGKEFAAQLVQEWQDAYMDYNYLKTILKDLLRFKQQQHTPSPMMPAKGPLKRRVSLYRAFSGLTSKYRNSPRKSEDEAILVSEGSDDGKYQTMLLMLSDGGGECELLFFRRLDDEFNKVVHFYKKKVEEVMAEADELSKQMNALIALRIKIENPMVYETKMLNLASSYSLIHPANGSTPGQVLMDTIQEVEMSGEKHSESERGASNGGEGDMTAFRPVPLEVLDHVQINIKPETPGSMLKGVLKSLKSDRSFTKRELKKAEQLMAQTFAEFYQKLRLLKSYCFLNQLAFSKIMKKYDKITSRNASKTYLEMVDNSYLGSSDEVTKLMERVEATFVKHFANGNRRKGMDTLRPKAKKERHTITFFLGTFFGCCIALIVAIFVALHARDVLNNPGRTQYMDNIFPLYSLFGYIFLHMLMYAGNIYFWKRFRVNYSFIFGFKQGTELGFREVLLVSSGLAVLTFAGVLSNLDMEMDPRTQSFKVITELVPLALLLVTLPDFFLADQLTSQVQAFRSLVFYICYYGWGDFKKRENSCVDSDVFKTFYLIVAIIPYWLRFLQCLRRLFEEKDIMHGANGLKVFSIIVAVATRTIAFEFRTAQTLKFAAIATSVVATVGATYWDIVIDWGLLHRNSRNPWLRDKLLVPNRSVYFIAMVLNILLRLAWMQTVLGFREAPFLHRTALTAIVASLEIIRRGIWNFFRLENEHLNNVGKYRAFKSVPLPFNYDDNEGKDA